MCHIGVCVKDNVKAEKINSETYDFSSDFNELSSMEKHWILKTAKILLRNQEEKAVLLTNIYPSIYRKDEYVN